MVKSSSQAEIRARAVKRQHKKELKAMTGKKRRKGSGGQNGEDDSDSDDSGKGQGGPTPAERRAAENGINPLSQLSKKSLRDEKRERVKTKNKAQIEDHAQGGQLITAESLPAPDFSNLRPFQREFWSGAAGEEPPSEALKDRRKAIGVNVKGQLRLCPPPIDAADSPGLPSCFAAVFTRLRLTAPSVVQQQCWPAILAGANVLALAPTGSGKTLAYGLPLVPHIQGALQALDAQTRPKGSNVTTPAAQLSTPKPAPYALVVVPTRELAIQVASELKRIMRPLSLRCAATYGGQDKEEQLQELSAQGGAHAVVATPGRLLDLVAGKQIVLSCVTVLVLDEADRMLQMGFYEQLHAISLQVRPDRQTLLFSATFPGKLREASAQWVGDAVFVRCSTFEVTGRGGAEAEAAAAGVRPGSDQSHADDSKMAVERAPGAAAAAAAAAVAPVGAGEGASKSAKHASSAAEKTAPSAPSSSSSSSLSVPASVSQLVHVCAAHKKPRLLIKFLTRVRAQEKESKQRQPGNMIVFCTKIKTLKFVQDFLTRQDVRGVAMIHGQMPQSMRERALTEFKAGKASILLATDVAARGLHIKKLQYVVNYDFPTNLEQYCHRVGRTGRQGEAGHAYSLITRNMAPLVADLVALLRSCQQEPEPNLLALEAEFSAGGFERDPEEEEEDGAEAE